jgi:hypothetical protein
MGLKRKPILNYGYFLTLTTDFSNQFQINETFFIFNFNNII